MDNPHNKTANNDLGKEDVASNTTEMTADIKNGVPIPDKKNDNEESTQEKATNEDVFPEENVHAQVGGQAIGAGRDANVNNINNVINQFSNDDQFKIKFKEVSPREKNRVRSIFDPPGRYEDKLKQVIRNKKRERLYFITGEEHSGKFTSAAHFALQLSDHFVFNENHIFRNTTSIPDLNSLSIYFRPTIIKEKSFYIITDIFLYGLTKRDFNESVLWGLSRALEEKDSYLIFTAEKCLQNSEYVFEIPIQAKKDLGDCFQKHFRWWMDEESSTTNSIVAEIIIGDPIKFKKDYEFPSQINEFFNMINKGDVISFLTKATSNEVDVSEILLEKNSVIKVLDQIAQRAKRFGKPDQEHARLWFNSLSLNARLFAMLAVLLDGIDYHIIYEIYANFAKQLRTDNIKSLVEPKQIGRDNLLTEIRAEVGEDHRIHFQDRSYWEQISSQLHNWHPLLWSLVDLLLTIASKYKSPEYWELRRAIGRAIARIGIHHPYEFKNKLTEIAKNESGPIVVIAGYAMEEACALGVENHPLIIEILNEWIEPESSKDMIDLEWAVASSIWRIYGGLLRLADEKVSVQEDAEQVQETIKKVSAITTKLTLRISDRLVGNQKNNIDGFIIKLLWQDGQNDELWKELTGTLENLTAIIFAIRQLMSMDSEKTVEILTDWFESRNPGLLIVAILSTQSLFEINSYEETQMPSEQRYRLLKLLQPALEFIQYFELKHILIESVFYSISTWYDLPDWKEKILSIFTPIFNRASDDDLELLVSLIIWHWLNVKNDDVQKAGMALIKRAYSIPGAPIDLIGNGSAILALDNSRQAHLSKIPLIGASLFPRLQSRIQTEIISLGKFKQNRWEGFLPTESQLHWGINTARIVVPPLESIFRSRKSIDLLITVATNEILDKDDIADLDVRSKILLLRVARRSKKAIEKAKKAYPDWVLILWDEEKFPFTDVNQMISAQIAKKNLGLDQQSLWGSIQPRFNVSPNDLEALSKEILILINKIDTTESLANELVAEDYVRTFNCILLYMAKYDLDKCLNFIDQLLNGSEQEKILGLTGVKALLKTFMHRVLSENDHDPIIDLLRFAQAAIRETKNWDLIKSVLFALENLTNRHNPHGVHIATTNQDFSIIQAIKSESKLNLSYSIASNVPYNKKMGLIAFLNVWISDGQRSDALRDFANQIVTYLSLGQGIQLPDISSEQRFGLIYLGNKNIRSNLDLFELVTVIIKNLEKSPIYPIVFKLGRTFPLAVGTDNHQFEEISLIHSPSFQPPYVLAPTMELFPADKIGFVLLLGDDDVLDYEEWLGELVRQDQLFDNPHLQKWQDWPSEQPGGEITPEEKEGYKTVQFILKRIKG